MPTFRCDFDVTGDLVLLPGQGQVELSATEDYLTTFENGPADKDGNATGLVAIVVGSAESLESAQEELRGVLAGQLDVLAFTTHSRFKITGPLRAIEWEPMKKERMFRAYQTFDTGYPPDPELHEDLIETANALIKANPPTLRKPL